MFISIFDSCGVQNVLLERLVTGLSTWTKTMPFVAKLKTIMIAAKEENIYRTSSST